MDAHVKKGRKTTRCLLVEWLKRAVPVVLALVVICLSLVGLAYALVRPYAYIGRVIGKETESATVQIQTEYVLGPSGWEAYNEVLEGSAPNVNAMNEIDIAEYVVATSLGVPGESWIALARMKSGTRWVITDIYGDPGYVWDVPLSGNFVIDYNNTPDCASCNGCNCEAKHSTLTITSQDNAAYTHQLNPGETYTHQDEYQSIDITFLSGQAPAHPECSDEKLFGPQAVSDFTIHIIGESEHPSSDSDCFISTVING